MAITENDISILSSICKKLGWTICVPGAEDDETVSGLVIGTTEFVDDVTSMVGGDFEVYTFPYDRNN